MHTHSYQNCGLLTGGYEPWEENNVGCTKETEPRAAMQPATVELTPFEGETRQEALQRKAAGSACGILPMLGKKSNMRS